MNHPSSSIYPKVCEGMWGGSGVEWGRVRGGEGGEGQRGERGCSE